MLEEFTGSLERIVYYNEESCFLVGRLRCPGGEGIPFVGSFPPLQKEEQLRLIGSWQVHRRYGRQLAVERWERLLPVTPAGLKGYLSSGLIKGIGPVTADSIVDHLGMEALTIAEQEPQRLLEVPGIGSKKADLIVAGLARHREIQQVMVFLQGFGINPGVILRLYRHYGAKTVDKVQENPYRLAEEIYGIGFKTADKIARQLGLPAGSPQRIEAAIIYSLDRAADSGHVYLPREKLISMVEDLISDPAEKAAMSADLITRLLSELADRQRIFNVPLESGEAIYKAGFYYAETGVAKRIQLLKNLQTCWENGQVKAALKTATRGPIRLTPDQFQVLEQALNCGMLVVTGGPGTGKTTIIKALLELFQQLGQKVLLAAPTGRAAKRVTEATGGEASTIHRLLEYGYQEGTGLRFQRHEQRPINAQVVIIDEASMVDLHLMHSLLKAIPESCRLILVGDVDQLPSVGAGSVLRDIIDSEKIPAVRLKNIFRQAGQSMIVLNAHRVNRGRLPLARARSTDFFIIKAEDPEHVASLVVQLCREKIPNYGRFDPLNDIQVITPMRRTAAGVEKLNALLQQALNPAHRQKPEIRVQGINFRLGDKVMQIQNNYRKEIFNGDIGRITSLDLEEGELIVSYPDLGKPREVGYDIREIDELALSYAVSVHKSQGSEYPVIIMPVLTQHYPLLQRNLLYTGITRARRMVVLVGSWKALAIAVNNDQVLQRYSNLSRRLQFSEGMKPAGTGLE